MRKILVHAYGAEFEPIKRALALVADFAHKNQKCRDIALYVYSRDKLRQPTTIAKVLGDSACKALLDRRTLPVSRAARLRLVTERTVAQGLLPDAVLAIYANDNMLDKVERRGGVGLTVAVPWNVESLGSWIAKWKPEEVGLARTAGE